MNYDDLEPHLNADGYRNHHPVNLVDKQIDFIECSRDGNFLVGCSSLTGRFWTGSLYYCKDAEGAPDNAIASVPRCETGLTDGKFIGDKKVIVAEDSGGVQVLTLQAKDEYPPNKQRSMSLTCICSSCEHDDTVTSLSVFPGLTHAVTGAMDKNLKVFDIETLVAEHTYRPAHRRSVTSVSAKPEIGNDCIFASCSLDGYSILWDTRTTSPATLLVKNTSCELHAVAWVPNRPNVLAIGSGRGNVSLVDIRQKDQLLGQIECFNRPIHRLRFAEHCPDWLAVCANDTQVKVFDCSPSQSKLIYNDDRHEDFVRGLAWHPITNKLISCGWDRQVLSHTVTSSTIS